MANILIVEDALSQALILERYLYQLDHQPDITKNGQEALDYLKTKTPDLILSDIEMPIMDGIELCSKVKSSPTLHTIPFILITSKYSASYLLKGLNAGADGYLTKPYEESLLQETIKNTLIDFKSNLIDKTPIQHDKVKAKTIEVDGQKVELNVPTEHIVKLFLSAYKSAMVQNSLLLKKELELEQINKKLSVSLEQLSASEERFRGLVQTIPDIIYKVDNTGCFTFLNDSVQRLGYHQSELIGRHFSELIYSEDVDRVSSDTVIANIRNQTSETNIPIEPPKLFDERRSIDRMTVGLEVRLKRKTGESAGEAEIKAISTQLVHVEVNSIGMYGDQSQNERRYVGTVGVIRDISDRIASKEALKSAKIAADSANKAKSEFLTSMSHELRTPLNAILGFSQLLHMPPQHTLNEEQISSLNYITDSGQHLLKLINEILDLAKIESGKTSFSIETVEPTRAIAQCLALTESLSKQNNLTIETNIEANVPNIRVDNTRFKQILINLLSNAVKYNKPGGEIELVCASTDDAMLRFSVIDTGFGISKENQKLLFQPFQRLGVDSTFIEGTGIGLTISRELVQHMNGRMGFRSNLDEGSCFWVDFPIAVGKFASNSMIIDEDLQNSLGSITGEPYEEKTILYIEDNPANIHLVERIIKQIIKCRIIIATNAEDGLKEANKNHPDLILLDIHLPKMSGLEAVRILKNEPATKDIPVIAVTAAALPHDIENGLKAGFDEYLTKPFKVSDMIEMIKKILSV
ncbi:MAG: response regulator [Gammaproteobacteria bacterium]|nr:response regulator [Gammaproteobacteria bacterium]